MNFTDRLNWMFTTGRHGCVYGNRRPGGDDAEARMHQASILFTAAVMAMAGAWYVMQDMSGRDAVPDAAAQTAAISAPAVLSE